MDMLSRPCNIDAARYCLLYGSILFQMTQLSSKAYRPDHFVDVILKSRVILQ